MNFRALSVHNGHLRYQGRMKHKFAIIIVVLKLAGIYVKENFMCVTHYNLHNKNQPLSRKHALCLGVLLGSLLTCPM